LNIEPTFTVLRREQLLIDHSPHSVQFENLTERLLRTFSAAAAIPPLTAEEIRLYAALALLHDVGKRAIPQEILNKPGHLTQEEFEVMKSHTTQGCELLERIPELRKCEVFPLICDVCRHHHERWDGSGYPDRLAGDSITPWVQVVGLADAFDALIHPRVYKPAYPKEQARDMIVSGACGVFHPLLLACFARHIGEISQVVYTSAC
jgi:putative two-component system response regulator